MSFTSVVTVIVLANVFSTKQCLLASRARVSISASATFPSRRTSKTKSLKLLGRFRTRCNLAVTLRSSIGSSRLIAKLAYCVASQPAAPARK